MPDTASINRSLSTARTELEYLRDRYVAALSLNYGTNTHSGVLGPAQFTSIMAQLPHDGKQSDYADARYVNGGHVVDPSQISQAAQNPEHPANPNHPKVRVDL